jgi:hypothetical protein
MMASARCLCQIETTIVSGIAALMLAANGNLSSAQLISRLREGSTAFPQTSVGETTQPPCAICRPARRTKHYIRRNR